MAKLPMTKEKIENIRGQILDVAIDIFIQEGFTQLSIRKIALKLNITATTIYRYYSGKDEILLMIRIKGFDKLQELLKKRSAPFQNTEVRLKAIILAYIEFGLNNPDYYHLISFPHTFRCSDFAGTNMESLAEIETKKFWECISLFFEPIGAYIPSAGKRRRRFILHQVAAFWGDLHGLVELYHSRLYRLLLEDVDDFVNKKVTEMIRKIFQMKENLDQGKKLF